mmetsp:Transcript_31600/g.28754  ORF Transcript_31600/g.28754 Transcript_31600/m.28754 type:complete len:93 (+) Transcript_31600:122-400(+)
MLTTFQVLEYLEFWRKATLLHTTLNYCKIDMAVFFGLCGCVFVGMGFLGYAFFWKYDHFESIGMTLRSMWALSCGDIVHDTFLSVLDEGLLK